MSFIGFTGGRLLSSSWLSVVENVVNSVKADGRGVAVGCADGLDKMVRESDSGARVFRVSSGQWGTERSAFARRSAAMVDFVVESGNRCGVVGFMPGPCPDGLRPSKSWPKAGKTTSGSWSTVAYSVGLGLPVVVFWCGNTDLILPSWAGGMWSLSTASNCWAGSWKWTPSQGNLF